MFGIDLKLLTLGVSVFLLSAAHAVVGFAIPFSQKVMIDRFIEREVFSVIPFLCAVVLGLLFISGFSGFMKDLATNAFRYRYVDIVSRNIARRYFSGSALDGKEHSDPVFLSRLSTVLNTLPESVAQLLNFWCAILITPAIGLYLLHSSHQDMLLIAIGVFAVQAGVNAVFSIFMKQKSHQRHHEKGAFSALASDFVYGLHALYPVRAKNKLFTLTLHHADQYNFTSFDVEKLRNIQEVIQHIAVGAGMTAVVWFGAHHILNGMMTYGDLLFCLIALEMTLHPTRDIASASKALKDIQAQKHAIEIMVANSGVNDNPRDHPSPNEIALVGASFSYGERAIISNASMAFRKGNLYLIRGRSGSGKSTLISGILGELRPSRGEVRWDGQPIQSPVHDKVGFFSQDDRLFHGTLLDNFTLFGSRQPSTEVLNAAISVSHAGAVLAGLPDGLGTQLPVSGVGFSGGQERRLCLARLLALSADKPLIILDEPTSNLDPELEEQFFTSLRALTAHKIIIVISHAHRMEHCFDAVFTVRNGEVFCDQ